MRHGKRFNHLSRTSAHRKAMLSNMAASLIMHKRIRTTVPKAKALRRYVEPLITKAKDNTTHSRRIVFSYLQDKHSVTELFNEVADRVAERPGGYTRIIKMGNRLGDNAEMCFIELVDYNELMLKESKPKKKRSRRAGRKKSKAQQETPQTREQKTATDEIQESMDKSEESKTEESKTEESKTEESKTEESKTEEPSDVADTKVPAKDEVEVEEKTKDTQPEEAKSEEKEEVKEEEKKKEQKKEQKAAEAKKEENSESKSDEDQASDKEDENEKKKDAGDKKS